MLIQQSAYYTAVCAIFHTRHHLPVYDLVSREEFDSEPNNKPDGSSTVSARGQIDRHYVIYQIFEYQRRCWDNYSENTDPAKHHLSKF